MEETLELMMEKEGNMAYTIEQLEAQNRQLKKEKNELLQCLNDHEQFKNELSAENKELSVELDLIKEKIN